MNMHVNGIKALAPEVKEQRKQMALSLVRELRKNWFKEEKKEVAANVQVVF